MEYNKRVLFYSQLTLRSLETSFSLSSLSHSLFLVPLLSLSLSLHSSRAALAAFPSVSLSSVTLSWLALLRGLYRAALFFRLFRLFFFSFLLVVVSLSHSISSVAPSFESFASGTFLSHCFFPSFSYCCRFSDFLVSSFLSLLLALFLSFLHSLLIGWCALRILSSFLWTLHCCLPAENKFTTTVIMNGTEEKQPLLSQAAPTHSPRHLGALPPPSFSSSNSVNQKEE